MDNLTFADLVRRISDETAFPQTQVQVIVKAALYHILNGLAEGERVALPNFGSFTPSIVAPRSIRNPSSGEFHHVPAKGKVLFRPSKRMREVAEAALSAMLDKGLAPDLESLIVLVQGEAEGETRKIQRALDAAEHRDDELEEDA